jgi:hypothetical protein
MDKNNAVVCCLLATQAVTLSEKKKRKRKIWSKKWYLKRNTSCDAHLPNELLEMDVPWDDAIVVSAGKLRKLWDSLSELRSSQCERRLERTVLRPALLPSKLRSLLSFPLGMTSHSKIAQFNWQCIGRFRYKYCPQNPQSTCLFQYAAIPDVCPHFCVFCLELAIDNLLLCTLTSALNLWIQFPRCFCSAARMSKLLNYYPWYNSMTSL